MGKREASNSVEDSKAKTVVQAGSVKGDVRSVHVDGDGTTVVNGDNHAPISHTFGRK